MSLQVVRVKLLINAISINTKEYMKKTRQVISSSRAHSFDNNIDVKDWETVAHSLFVSFPHLVKQHYRNDT